MGVLCWVQGTVGKPLRNSEWTGARNLLGGGRNCCLGLTGDREHVGCVTVTMVAAGAH